MTSPTIPVPAETVLVPRAFIDFLRRAPVASGTCCCGDEMENHADPMSCGHSPVDMWDHALGGWLEKIAVIPAPTIAGEGLRDHLATAHRALLQSEMNTSISCATDPTLTLTFRTVDDMRCVAEFIKWAWDQPSAALAASPALASPVPSDVGVKTVPLLYRPNSFDDWGMIRTLDGAPFATVTRPLSKAEADEHRQKGTDPFEPLARALMSALAGRSGGKDQEAVAGEDAADLTAVYMAGFERGKDAERAAHEETTASREEWCKLAGRYQKQRDEALDRAEAAEAAEARSALLEETAKGDLQYLEDEARRFASHYAPNSDGWNTFIIFADKIADRASLTQHKAPALHCKGYMPDYQAMGDCVNCGRVREDHPEFATAKAPALPASDAEGGANG